MIEFIFSSFWVFAGVTLLMVVTMAFILRLTALFILAYKGDTLSQESRTLIGKVATSDDSEKGG